MTTQLNNFVSFSSSLIATYHGPVLFLDESFASHLLCFLNPYAYYKKFQSSHNVSDRVIMYVHHEFEVDW